MPIKKLLKYIKKLEVNETLAVGIIFFVLAIPIFIFLREESILTNSSITLATNEPTKNIIKNTSQEKLIVINTLADLEKIKYDLFWTQLGKICPYYEPDGNAYHICLENEMNRRLLIAENLYNDIREKLAVKALKPNTHVVYRYLPTQLAQLELDFEQYSSSTCRIEELSHFGGSASPKIALACRIYEIEKYINLLDNIREKFSL